MAKRLNIVEEKFLDTIKNNNLINSGDKIVVGVSGGPDSLTLLTLLNKYKSKFNYEIIVAHVNHLIRKDSTDDEQFVENYCKKNGIKFYYKRVNVQEIAKQQKKGEEAMTDYEMINIIVNKGYAEDAMAAARKAGAGGGTIIGARGTAKEGDSTFFGVEIVPEKEMLMILVPAEKKAAVVEAVTALPCFAEAGSGIIFCNEAQDFTLLGKK